MVNWRGNGETTVHDITAAPKNDNRPAEVWLNDILLKKGPWLPAKYIITHAKKAGFSDGQIKRARTRLNVATRRTKTTPSRTEWSLPDWVPSDEELRAAGLHWGDQDQN